MIAGRLRSDQTAGTALPDRPGRLGSGLLRREWVASLALGLVAFFVFRASPVRMMLDSKYALLSSEALLHDRSWDVSRYVPRVKALHERDGERRKSMHTSWQLRLSRGRLVYFYPPGSSLLSLPAVALMNAAGLSSISSSGAYDLRGERAMQIWLATLLSAVTVVLCTRLARRELPLSQSLVIGLVAAFGTAIWSTASRILWMQTWGVLVTAAALLELLRWEDGERRRPELLGFLLVAAFWVRPTSAMLAGATALYVLWRHRPAFLRLIATGALGALAYLAFTAAVWGGPTKGYVKLARGLGRANVFVGIFSLLADPTRGVLVFSPFLMVALLVLLRLGIRRERRGFALFLGVVAASSFALYGGYRAWFGLGTVGYRYLTELCPVFAWLAAHAWRRQREERIRLGALWRSGIGFFSVVAVAASVLAHASGAFDFVGSGVNRGLLRPESARMGPHGEPDYYGYLDVAPQRVPLAYWGLLPAAAADREAHQVDDEAP